MCFSLRVIGHRNEVRGTACEAKRDRNPRSAIRKKQFSGLGSQFSIGSQFSKG